MSPLQQQSVGPREIVTVVIVVIAVVIMMGLFSARPAEQTAAGAPPGASVGHAPPGATPGLDDPEKASAHADALARQSGGDLMKLSDMDQRWLDASTAGHAQEFVIERLKALKAQDKSRHAQKKPLPKAP